jgi:hypothetical protein
MGRHVVLQEDDKEVTSTLTTTIIIRLVIPYGGALYDAVVDHHDSGGEWGISVSGSRYRIK